MARFAWSCAGFQPRRTRLRNSETSSTIPRYERRCFTPLAAREVLPYYEMRTKLAMQGKNSDEIAEGLQAAYARGELPRRDVVSFAYMWSADQQLGSGIGHWHPHMMVFAPYYDNSMVGGKIGRAHV